MKMFSLPQKMRQMDLSQSINSPTTPLILLSRWKRRSKRSLHPTNWMRRPRLMVTADLTASNLPPRKTAHAINLSFPMRHATLTSALYRQTSLFANSPRQNPSSGRKPTELTSKHGLSPHSNFVNEESHSDPQTS